MSIGDVRRCCRLFVVVLAGVLVLGARAQKVTRNIAYAGSLAPAECGDLYQPVGAGPFAAVVYLHGGSWRSGSKGNFDKLAADLAVKGYVGFSVNYDLRAGTFPLAWEEARAAVGFVRAHAAEYHIDPAKIVIAGTSAGGELAALVALAPQGPAKPTASADTSAVPVMGAVILNGVFDLENSGGVIKRYLGAECGPTEEPCQDASPLQHVHAGAPPFFVGHGTGDGTVPFSEAKRFAGALREAHVPVKLYVAEGGPHMYWEKKTYYAANLDAVVGFLAGLTGAGGGGGSR